MVLSDTRCTAVRMRVSSSYPKGFPPAGRLAGVPCGARHPCFTSTGTSTSRTLFRIFVVTFTFHWCAIGIVAEQETHQHFVASQKVPRLENRPARRARPEKL